MDTGVSPCVRKLTTHHLQLHLHSSILSGVVFNYAHTQLYTKQVSDPAENQYRPEVNIRAREM
jgi:hypothetical protein